MHAPASVSGARRRLALPAALRRPPRLPGGRHGAIAAACIAGILALFGIVLIYTPIAHPKTLIVAGVTGPSERRITNLLEDAASKQSTFAVDSDALMRAVAAYPEVAGIDVESHPPFRLEIRAIMRPPVGRVDIGGRGFVVAADGTILQRAAGADVPRLDPTVGETTVRDGRVIGARAALRIVGAAPQPLLEIARTVRIGHAGVEIEMSHGPRLVFGSGADAADKWAAAAAIIADGSADGATYIDLRVPSRPAVGGIGGTQSASSADPPTLTATQNGTGTTTGAVAATSGAGATGGASTTAQAPAAGTTTGGAAEGSSGAASGAVSSGATAQTAPATGATQAPSTGTATGGDAQAAPTGGGAAIGATP